MIHLAGTPFSIASAPYLMDQAPLLRGVPAKFHKMELPPNLTVYKKNRTYHTEYQPTRAGNLQLPIPAKPPVNKWDATLISPSLLLSSPLLLPKTSRRRPAAPPLPYPRATYDAARRRTPSGASTTTTMTIDDGVGGHAVQDAHADGDDGGLRRRRRRR
jgi:hypothetical protein